jgi:predicted protein tyrosine phosphatase
MKPTIREVSAISILSARNWNAQPREAMISITGTGEARVTLKKGWAYRLRLCFDDIEVPTHGRKIFTEEDADRVLDLLDKIEGKVDHVIVHCTHGLSRSPGIARFISERYDLSNGFGNHRTFNRHVFKTLFIRWRHRVAPGKGVFVDMGLARADDPIYNIGPVVAGRPILQSRRPYTAEDSARDFKIVRDAIAKDGWKPGYQYVNGKWEPPGKQGESDKKGGTT